LFFAVTARPFERRPFLTGAIAMAAHDTPAHSGASLSLERIHPYENRGMAVVSNALDVDGRIDDRYSAYHDDLVPGLAWSAVIEAESYAVIVEDPDAPMAEPFVHWMVWNIPGQAIEIPAGLSRSAHPPELPGAVQGRNSGGGHGWHGTKPPVGHGVHHYHFQVFAVNRTPPGTAALSGWGEVGMLRS
jgi:Raf kinase inhibitor-like YbhB/YbcL family protein